MGLHVGQTLGDYVITALVGAGAMGRVYKVEHSLTKRTEAMKVLFAELASEIQIKRFEREMRSLARLNHPNIAALHNAIHSENQLILLIEFVDGQTLESLFRAGRQPLVAGVRYIEQILAALAYAHQQGVVHRDVTPANVMITPANEVKLSDFGLSKSYGDSLLTNCGEVLGSLPYLAPEQLKGTTQPDRRSDLYSVGAILYEHLTGQKAFPSRRLSAVLTDSEDDPPPPSQVKPELPRQWDAVVLRALARNPVHRYQSGEEFLEAIRQVAEHGGADRRWPQSRRVGIAIAICAGLFLAVTSSPMVKGSHPVAPISVPWERLHIAPPAFALEATPAGIESDAGPTADLAQPVEHRHMQSAGAATRLRDTTAVAAGLQQMSTGTTKRAVVVTNPVAATTPSAVPAPDAAAAVNDATTPVDRIGPELSGPAAPVEAQPEVAPTATKPAKRHFWNKLNIFRKRHADPDEDR